MYLQLFDTAAESLESVFGEGNAGGLRRLRLVPSHQLQFIHPERFPPPGQRGYDDIILSDQHLIFAPGYMITDVDVLPELAEFSEPAETSSQGVFFNPSIQIVLPKIRPDVTIWIHRNREVRWIAFIGDRNGFFRCVGTPTQPLRLAIQAQTGTHTGRNQTVLSFAGSVSQPAYYMDGIENEDLINPLADFDESFSFDFNS
ncbi:hypothetical protein ACO2Q8_16710 [Larkinella sp. VNQ87]|uniref:hypothetical protein n=1 Tax=Larkinella sp. VNQ87 TaxID=3400921 RepID=UPI003BFFF4F4